MPSEGPEEDLALLHLFLKAMLAGPRVPIPIAIWTNAGLGS